MKSRLPLLLIAILLLVAALPAAADVTVGGTVNFSSLDGSAQDDDHIVNGVFTVNGNLTVQGTINCNDSGPASASACSMKFAVSGDVTMLTGSAIFAENRSGPGNGGNIIVQAGGNFTMQGPVGILNGAKISSARTSSGGTNDHAGDITISAGGTSNVQAGSHISAAANNGSAGTITVNGAGVITVAGVISAGGSDTVNNATKYTAGVFSGSPSAGGTIRITSSTHTQPALVITADAVIASEGGGTTGSVTLEGCDVRILGLIASISDDGTGARVVVRSGTTILVDGRDVNRPSATLGRFGVIRADSSSKKPDGSMRADLFAANDISVFGPDPALSSIYSVNANPDGSNNKDVAGSIRVTSTAGGVTASGNAFSATTDNAHKGEGGSITIASRNNALLNGATLKASGQDAGGHIQVRSYSGSLNWQLGVGDVRPVGSSSGVAAALQGTIALTYCTTISTSGTSFPTNGPPVGLFPTIAQSCSPAAPSLPAGEPVLPTCNRPPAAVNDAYIVAEGGTLNVAAPGVLTNDSDPDGDPITAVLVSGPAHASSFVLNANGSFNYVHDGSETTSDSFTYRASDGSATSNIATVNITITPVNDVPVANNDNATVAEGGTINMAAPGVLANDTDPDGPNPLTASLVTGPAHASSFVLNPNGSYVYVHDGSETTSDSFTYTASDGVATSNIATVNITITPVNDAPVANNDSYTVAEGGTLNQSAPGVLGNDTDPDSPTLTAVLVSGPAHASSFTLNPNGSFNYVHDGSETLTDSFTYRANDGSLNSNIATVNITITPVNDAPVAVNDGPYNVAEGGTLNVATPGVLANDTDPDSPTLTAVLVSGPAHASSFALNPDGSFTYVHDGSETLTDSFTYRANDGSLNSNVATVTIAITPVNDAPTAVNDTYTVAEGGTLNTPAPGVLANDTDPDSPTLTAGLVSGPAHASSFSFNADGSFTYVHDGSETTSDSFTYRASDGLANSNLATVTITITPVNDAPVAANDAYAVNEGGTINAVAPGVLGNDTDVDSPTLTAVLVSAPVHASSFALNADGSFTYVHDGSETTSDVFTYKASDGSAFSNVATVTITVTAVNDAPVVTAGGTLTFTEGDAATVIDNTITITDSDSTNLTGATVTISGNYASGQDVLGFTNTANITGVFNAGTGTLTLTGTDTLANYQAALRSVTYANASTNPSTSPRTVTWQVDDGAGVNNLSAPVTSTINVISTNSAPQLANGSTISYTENDAATVINSVITVSDVDSPTLAGATVQITSGYNSAQDVLSFAPVFGISGSFNSGTGTLTLSGTSSVANYQSALRTVKYSNTSEDPTTAARTVTFQVDDGDASNNLSNIVSSTVNVTAVNDPPTAVAFSGLPAQAGIPITYPAGKLSGSDVEAGTTITIDTTPINVTNGTVSLNANGSFTFTPLPSAAGGTASFQYRVSDNGNPAPGLNSAYVTVSFNVAGPAIYFVKSTGTGNCTLGNECTLTTALAFITASPNRIIFISDANSHVAGPFTLNPGGSIIGQGIVAPSFDTLFGIGTPAHGTLAPRPLVNQARPTLSNSPITLNTNSAAAGFNMSNNSGDTLIASSKSGLLVKDMDVTTSAASGTFAVHFTNSSGLFTFGTITNSAGGGGVNFTGTTSASSVSFGNVSTSSGDAVTIATSGATNFSFATVSSTTGKAVGITTATGAFSFTKISSNGASKGITVSALTGAGSFTVNGTGGLCDSTHTGAGDCTGGTIQSSTLRGAEFVNAANVSLTDMYFKGDGTTNSGGTCVDNVNAGSNVPCNAAVYLNGISATSFTRLYLAGIGSADMGLNGNAVNGLTMTNVEIANFTANQKDAAVFQNLTGTVTINGLNEHNNALEHNFMITNNSGTANVTFTSPVIQNSPLALSGNADGINAQAYGLGTTLNITATGVTLNNLAGNSVNWSPNSGAHMTAVLNGGASTLTAGIFMTSTGNNPQMNYTITGLTVTTNATGSNAITVGRGSLSPGGVNSAETGSITNNNITVGSANCSTCFGISINSFSQSGLSTTTVTGNTIAGNAYEAINVVAAGGANSMNLTIQNNSMSTTQTSGNAAYAIDVTSGGFGSDTNCLFLNLGDMSPLHTVPANRNTIVGLNWDFGGNQISLAIFDSAQLKLSNYTGSTDAQAATWVTLSNTTTGTDAFALGTNQFGGGAVCP
ncbi:MAG TPA: Ig-like domain-containing protein [Thermoanaerobaculia bacterium]|nr:Ig-like domain-containing protein [Thermoanaerobaculia bacterium]